MNKLGLIGKTLGHSWSKRWFEAMFAREGIENYQYELYELPTLDGFRDWVFEQGLQGFNVTIPYKEAVIPHLDDLDAVAAAIGAVNCVTLEAGRLIGRNTDAPAFAETIQPLLQAWHTAALILGTGGAAKAVAYALNELHIDSIMVSRTPDEHPGSISYLEACEAASERFLIVNATPAGMSPNEALTPWPYTYRLGMKHLCYDLIYNPEETRFMTEAELCGAQVCNGLPMLERQAELSWMRFAIQ